MAGNTSQLNSCIVWDNLPDGLESGNGQVTAIYSNVQAGWPGMGNLNADPMFYGPQAFDVRLLSGSVCIDSGNPGLSLDPNGSRADMGAFTFDLNYLGDANNVCEAKVNSAGCLPRMDSVGNRNVSGPDDFHLLARNIMGGGFGFALLSPMSNNTPFFGGTLCVGGPFYRLPLVPTGGTFGQCDGVLDTFVPIQTFTQLGFQPGDLVYAQYWYRDSGSQMGQGYGLTDALEFRLEN